MIKKTKWVLSKIPYIKKTDKRYKKYKKQLKKLGFCDVETWNLGFEIADFILPRLKRFKELVNGHPCDITTMDKWYEMIDKMIYAFEWAKQVGNDDFVKMSDKEIDDGRKKYKEGMDIFSKRMLDIWW